MGKIIAVVNQKGGVGKTTLAVNLTAALHDLGLKVLLCDFDPQANATSGMGVDKRKIKYSAYDVTINDIPLKDAIVRTEYGDVLPSSADLAGASVELIEAPQFPTGLYSVGTDVDDLDETLEILKTKGCTILGEIVQTTVGRQIFILDPNGVRICLIEHTDSYREKYMK